jgi:hypothetical protein
MEELKQYIMLIKMIEKNFYLADKEFMSQLKCSGFYFNKRGHFCVVNER